MIDWIAQKGSSKFKMTKHNSNGWGSSEEWSIQQTGGEYDDSYVSAPNVLLYIDNSNIFESAKKYSAHKKGYRNGIPDVACRIDIGKLISRAIGNRRLLFGKLYGSEPPALDSVWEAIRRKHVYVETFQRSTWTLKEKETDSSLTADAVEDIIIQQDNAGDSRTLILFSGDRDLLRVVDKAIKFGYQVEIWSFKISFNNTVKRRALEEPSKVKIFNIDDIFDEITYTKVVWGKKKTPPERSLVSSIALAPNEDKKKFLSKFVAKAGDIFKLPMMGKYLDNYQYILLVPCIKEHYSPKPNQNKSRSEQGTIRTYDYYKHIQPFTHQLEECFFQQRSKIITWIEFLALRNPYHQENFISGNRFQYLTTNDDENEEIDEGAEIDFDVENLSLSDDDSEDFDCNDFFDFHHEDLADADGDFIPNVRKEAKPRRQYSDPCHHKFWCTKGLNCNYKHNDQQRQFFKVQPDAKFRRLYKIKPCFKHLHIDIQCQFEDKPYLCGYAHTIGESRCLCCKQEGSGKHWMDQCPLNRSNQA